MQTFITIYLVAAALGSAMFLFAGFHARRSHARETWPPLTSASTGGAEGGRPGFNGSQPAEVQDAVVVALGRLSQELRERGTRVEVALRSGLLVSESGHRLADMLERMVAVMAAGADEHILLSGVRQGSQIVIRIANDAPHADRQDLQARLRPVLDAMALWPATLDVEVESGHGATLLLRLAAAAPLGRSDWQAQKTDTAAAASPAPALRAAAQQ